MPTLHHLTNIIPKQEVVNILNIANLVPQGIVNENQCTDKCTVLCFTSTRIKKNLAWFEIKKNPGRDLPLSVPVPPQWSNNPTAP